MLADLPRQPQQLAGQLEVDRLRRQGLGQGDTLRFLLVVGCAELDDVAGVGDDQIRERIRSIWQARTDRYSEIRSEATLDLPKVEMSYIGG